ncbi:hypothetical protein FZEAL_9855 [Fusarium zealandicum]|uniref:C2H2-type domain-containing protein n=1 Tax=Fusarium zealandicum TaxID=1053134 RepID=A0A8H4XEP4_9HYPO|nr:hypothetical protein FZEAL_9855 [Fusarium zealandicum]
MADNSIAESVNGCLELFHKTAPLQNPGPEASHYAPLTRIHEEEGRFNVWSGNIGAHKSGRRSLQYRLRDASHLQKQVLALLKDLSELLEDVVAIVAGDVTPWDELEDDEPLDDGDASTELEQIATDVSDVINCLLRLSVAIRNPAPHNRFATSGPIEASHYEPFDIQHVQAKFEKMDPSLVARLGKSVSRRRQYFKYRESHHLKLSHGLVASEQRDGESTTASSIPGYAKAGPLNLQFSAIDEDALSDSGVTQTSVASSGARADKISIPPLPNAAQTGPFECPFCYMIITVTNSIAWKRHVFADLRPYVCLSEDCTETEKEFARRHEWILHEVQNHWKTYPCPLSCPESFQSELKCRDHIQNAHAGTVPTNQLGAMISLSSRPIQAEDGISCPMCKEDLHSVKEYQRHVGRHQEQLALFALPTIYTPEDHEEVGGENNIHAIQSDSESSDIIIDTEEVQELLAENEEELRERYSSSRLDHKDITTDEDLNQDGDTDDGWSTTAEQGEIMNLPRGQILYSDASSIFTGHKKALDIDRGGPRPSSHRESAVRVDPLTRRKSPQIYVPSRLDKSRSPRSLSERERRVEDDSRYMMPATTDTAEAISYSPNPAVSPEYSQAQVGPGYQAPPSISQGLTNKDFSNTGESSRQQRIFTSSEEPRYPHTAPRTKEDEHESLKGILKQPKSSFPEETNPLREGVSRPGDRRRNEAPPEAKWTKISRKVVDPEALTMGKERFEVRDDFVIVLRVLSSHEIQAYANATQRLRLRERHLKRHRPTLDQPGDESQDRGRSRDGNEADSEPDIDDSDKLAVG